MIIEISRYIFEKKTHISNFRKIRLVGAEFYHADGQTHMTKLTVAFAILRRRLKKPNH